MRKFLPIVATLLAGCLGAGGGGTHAGESYVVNTQRTQFYKYGPAQVTNDDVAMYKGQKVTMLSRQFGYSHVFVEGGQTGYIATEDLATAPKETPPPGAKAGRHGRGGGIFSRAPTREEESTVPPPDLPKPQAEPPIFRY